MRPDPRATLVILTALLVGATACGQGGPASPVEVAAVSTTTTVAPTTAVPATTTAPSSTTIAATATSAIPTTAVPTTAVPTTVTPTTATSTTVPPATTTAPTSTTVATTTTSPVPTTTFVLEDTFRGVTSEAIKIGLTVIDFESLNRIFHLSLTYDNWIPVFEAVVADINSRGGILGRRVDLVSRSFLPVGSVTADAACTELTEDEQVFAVVNGFAGPGAEDVNECFTDLHETVLVGGHPTPEQINRARAPWIAYDMSLTRRGVAFVNLLRKTGWLDDLGPYLILGANPEYQPIIDDMVTALEEADETVSIVAISDYTGDEAATIFFLDVLTERARVEGVESFLVVGEDPYTYEYLVRLGGEFNLLIHNGDSISSWSQDPPPNLESTLVITNMDFSSRDDPTWGRCLQIADAVAGTAVRPPTDLTDGETNHWAGMVNACQSLNLFEMVASAAGPHLTNESFAGAAASLGPIDLPGYAFASLGPDKHDARDSLTLARWNNEEMDFEAISEPTDVSD